MVITDTTPRLSTHTHTHTHTRTILTINLGNIGRTPHKGPGMRSLDFFFFIVSLNNCWSSRSTSRMPRRSCDVTVMISCPPRGVIWINITARFPECTTFSSAGDIVGLGQMAEAVSYAQLDNSWFVHPPINCIRCDARVTTKLLAVYAKWWSLSCQIRYNKIWGWELAQIKIHQDIGGIYGSSEVPL